MAPRIAGIPNRSTTCQLAFKPTNPILKRLFNRCTMPVKAIATSISKKSINAGVRMVPRPNPEKNVRSDANAATTPMMINSMLEK